MRKIEMLGVSVLCVLCAGAGFWYGLQQPRNYLRSGVQWQFSEAASRGDVSEMQRLHSLGAEIDGIPEESFYQGVRAIEYAALTGQPRAVRWLIDNGANVTTAYTPDTPISLAEDHLKDAEESVSILKASGAKHWNEK
jgi:hypothetical protein